VAPFGNINWQRATCREVVLVQSDFIENDVMAIETTKYPSKWRAHVLPEIVGITQR